MSDVNPLKVVSVRYCDESCLSHCTDDPKMADKCHDYCGCHSDKVLKSVELKKEIYTLENRTLPYLPTESDTELNIYALMFINTPVENHKRDHAIKQI